jgi:sulfate transport system permease protein
VLPGFGLSLGFSLFYLSAIVLIPLSALVLRPLSLGWAGFFAEVSTPRVVHALELSFGAAAIAAAINTVFGLIVAWVLVRYKFPFRRLIDALVDLPFALPTAVAGVALATIYAPNGWLGSLFARIGIKTAYSPLGVVLALTFIGLPFVVRTLQPVLAELGRDAEEAAATLGAHQTFRRVVLPALAPALITGSALAFARAVGEYGSVIFIAGNLPMVSEIAPLLIVIKLEEYDYAGAAAIGVVMLAISFTIVLLLNIFQAWVQSRR